MPILDALRGQAKRSLLGTGKYVGSNHMTLVLITREIVILCIYIYKLYNTFFKLQGIDVSLKKKKKNQEHKFKLL